MKCTPSVLRPALASSSVCACVCVRVCAVLIHTCEEYAFVRLWVLREHLCVLRLCRMTYPCDL